MGSLGVRSDADNLEIAATNKAHKLTGHSRRFV